MSPKAALNRGARMREHLARQEQPSKPAIEQAPDTKQTTPNCPAGGRFGIDCHQLDYCQEECPEALFNLCNELSPNEEESIDDGLAIEGEVKNQKGEVVYFTLIPQKIIDDVMPKIKSTALKLFLYLARRANFNVRDKFNYGKCYLTHTEIAAATGIGKSQLARYDKDLEKLGLISVETKTTATSVNGKPAYKSIHVYSVLYFFDETIRRQFTSC